MPSQRSQKGSKKRRSPAPVLAATTMPCPYAAFLGIDWADEKHEVAQLEGETVHRQELLHSPEAIDEWANQLNVEFGGRPVAICIEQAQIRIIFRCWKNNTPYDDERYTAQLRRKGVNYLPPLKTA